MTRSVIALVLLAGALVLLNAYGGAIGGPPARTAAVSAVSRIAEETVSVESGGSSPDGYGGSSLLDALSLDRCDQLFVDGGSNLGEAVTAFLAGTFFTCATTGPDRIYRSDWRTLSKPQRQARMAALAAPKGFCIRSFEPAPALLPPLEAREAVLRGQGLDVRFVHGALSNATRARERREVVTFSRHPQGEGVTSRFRFDDIHLAPGGLIQPKQISARAVDVPGYDLAELLERVRQRNASTVVAVRLDVEGGEYEMVAALLRRPELLCFISFLFVEYHHSATPEQRLSLPRYGLDADAFERLKEGVHAAMERPGCRLQLYWRSFWASCGDQQRFEWRDSAQATST